MRKLISGAFIVLSMFGAARANDVLARDTADPLYMLSREEILSQSTVTYWDDILRAGQSLSYGVNDRLLLGANIHYQLDFDGDENGFSSIDLGGVYRAGMSGNIISDILFGFKFGGSSHVRTPNFADSTYYAGLRFGRQWAGVTLAGTVKSSWVFDDTRGMSFIDMTPEVYFRLDHDMRIGMNFTWRKATNPDYDQEWVGAKFVRQYGRTQYIGHIDYEYESDDIQVGAQVNILF